MCFLSEPMKVWFVTKPHAKFACQWAEPCIAGVSLVNLITAEGTNQLRSRNKEKISPGNTTTFRAGIDLSARPR